MLDYKLYFLDEDGRIRHALDMECESDEQAVAFVRKRRDGVPLELWRGVGFIHSFPVQSEGEGGGQGEDF